MCLRGLRTGQRVLTTDVRVRGYRLRRLRHGRLAEVDGGAAAAAHVGQGAASTRLAVRHGSVRVMKVIDGSAIMEIDRELSNGARTKRAAKE